jgi:hypothetical protein
MLSLVHRRDIVRTFFADNIPAAETFWRIRASVTRSQRDGSRFEDAIYVFEMGVLK